MIPNYSIETDSGERVTHLYQNNCYFAHLSIYYFASQFCEGGMVLDAGSGTGYGSAYLADHGARFVWGIEINENAVAESQQYFQRPNLQYIIQDLQNIMAFQKHHFDVIFSSNALEHVPDASSFFLNAWRLLKPEGTLILAVPPITKERELKENIDNIYHLNIWTPRQWHHAVSRFFSDVQCYRHSFYKPNYTLDLLNTPEQTLVNETEFFFSPISLDEYYSAPSLTVILVARGPRSFDELPLNKPLDFVDESFTRPPAESADAQSVDKDLEIRTLSAELGEKNEQLRRITSSLGWRLLSRYGRIKHRYLLPIYRLLKLK